MDQPRSAVSPARTERFGVVLALLLGAAAAVPLFAGPGMVLTRAGGDSPFLLIRVQQLAANLRSGVLLARWMPQGAYGLGYPFYDFYGSLPYYVAALLHWVGCDLVLSIQATQALGFLLASLGAYALARSLSASPLAAAAVAAAYTFAPYHLANVYVRGDALSEFTAMALYPLVLTSIQALSRRQSPGRVMALGVSFAALILTHNVSALLFAPLAVAWLLAAILAAPSESRRSLLTAGVAGLALGLLLSAWFWAPALREQVLVQLQDQTTGYLHYAGHLLRDGLVQTSMAHAYSLTAQTHPFRMGAVQAGLGLAALAAFVVRTIRQRRVSPLLALCALAALAYTLMMLPLSAPAWEHLPLIAMAQFPWRMLSIQALLVALLAVELLPGSQTASSWIAAALVIGLVAYGGMGALSVDRVAISSADTTPERFMLYEGFSGNIGTTIRHEYLPRWMVPRPYSSAAQLNEATKPTPLALEGELVNANPVTVGPHRQVWSVEVASRALLAFHTTYYPGWEAQVDGVPQGVEPLEGLGLVGLRVEAGQHQVEMTFHRTPVRRYSLAASLGALVIATGLAALSLRASRRARRCLVVAVLVGLATTVGLVGVSQASERQAGGPVIADFDRCPLLHAEPGGVVWGDARLLAYAVEPTVAAPGEAISLSLQWEGAATASVRAQLMGLTGHLLPPAPVWTEATSPISQSATELVLELPASIAPGLYGIYLDVLDGNEVLVPATSSGQTMGRVMLLPVRVTSRGAQEPPATPLGQFGPPDSPPVIALEAVRSHLAGDELLRLELDWYALAQAPRNYWMSVRLQDADGATLVSRDIPPLLGGYPTSLWRPGERIQDQVLLSLPEGGAEGLATIEVVLYDRSTLASIGSVTTPPLPR
ncbi:MAG: 6-pyruvoyl-tetrahydropterin synthase-related protein [Anaerolineae bacterium]|jgi:hypothetical protein